MRIGVIRGDLSGPIHIRDLETVSQFNPTTEPRGQELYLSRPTTAEVEAALANSVTGAGAVIEGSDIAGSFPITINGTNDDLKVRTSAAAAFTTVLVAQTSYANIGALVTAVNVALAGTGITARQGTGSGTRLALESNTKGVTSYLEIDTSGNGSVFNTPAGFTAGARTMATAAAIITATNPVGGALNVATATINAVGTGTNTNALGLIPSSRGTVTAVADAIAPRITETSQAVDSWISGMIYQYRSASYNPDPRRGLANGAAIAIVQDDGSTAFSAGVPALTTADLDTPTAGAMTLTGTNMGSYDKKDTIVKVVGPNINKRLEQKTIENAGGTVSATSIVIPAALLTGATLTTTSVRVQVRQKLSGSVVTT